MRSAVGLVMMVLSTGSALAQTPGMYFPMGEEKTLTDEEKAKQSERERAYKSTIGKMPDQKAADPWGSVRGNDTTAKKPAQTGTK